MALGKRPKLKIYGTDYDTLDGTGVRDYVHVSDIADAHVTVMERMLLMGGLQGPVNVGYGQGCSVLEVIEAVQNVTGKKLPYEVAPRREGDVAYSVASNHVLADVFGWKPKFNSLEKMIETAYAWEQKQVT